MNQLIETAFNQHVYRLAAGIHLVNDDNQTEVARYDLTEDASTETAMVFGELYRHGTEWKLKAVGQGFTGGLSALASQHGVNI